MSWASITLLVAMSQAGIVRGSKGVCGSEFAGSGKVEFPVSQVRAFAYAFENPQRTPML
jgi:hypothetical protein